MGKSSLVGPESAAVQTTCIMYENLLRTHLRMTAAMRLHNNYCEMILSDKDRKLYNTVSE